MVQQDNRCISPTTAAFLKLGPRPRRRSECTLSDLRDEAPRHATLGINVVEGLTAVTRCGRPYRCQRILRNNVARHCRMTASSRNYLMLRFAPMAALTYHDKGITRLYVQNGNFTTRPTPDTAMRRYSKESDRQVRDVGLSWGRRWQPD